jgi:hypothetical protein
MKPLLIRNETIGNDKFGNQKGQPNNAMNLTEKGPQRSHLVALPFRQQVIASLERKNQSQKAYTQFSSVNPLILEYSFVLLDTKVRFSEIA